MKTLTLAIACLSMAAALPARSATDDPWAFSFDLRERATHFSAVDFDRDSPDAGWVWTQRALLGANYQGSGMVSGRVSLLSALQSGDPSPVAQNNLDLQEAWLGLQLGPVFTRVGRQEIWLGSQRLLGTREGTNVRRNWDGVRAQIQTGGWTIDAFGIQLVDVEPDGVFNDTSDGDRRLAGLYGTRDFGRTKLDLYYLLASTEDRQTIEGTADQDRHSVGLRSFGERGPLFWNWEAIYQFGDHGASDVRAWTLATNTGLRMDGAWSPEFMLSANVASGDRNPGDGRLETFDALYPRGNYFSELAQLGPANFFNINPYLTVTPTEDLTLSFDVNFFWRLETSDGVYGPPGNIIRQPGNSDERFVNTAMSLAASWQASRHWRLNLSLTRSRPEAFIENTGAADTTHFAEFTLSAGFN